MKYLPPVLIFLFLSSIPVFGLESQQLKTNWAPDLQQVVVSVAGDAQGLSDLEAQSYSALMDIQDLADPPTPDQRFRLEGIFGALSNEDSYPALERALELMPPFEDYLRRHRVIPSGETCLCSNHADCDIRSGYRCVNVECTSQEGTNYSGICKKTPGQAFLPVFEEMFPLDPLQN